MTPSKGGACVAGHDMVTEKPTAALPLAENT